MVTPSSSVVFLVTRRSSNSPLDNSILVMLSIAVGVQVTDIISAQSILPINIMSARLQSIYRIYFPPGIQVLRFCKIR